MIYFRSKTYLQSVELQQLQQLLLQLEVVAISNRVSGIVYQTGEGNDGK